MNVMVVVIFCVLEFFLGRVYVVLFGSESLMCVDLCFGRKLLRV